MPRTLLAASVMSVLVGASSGAASVEISVTGTVGYFAPLGEWTSHRYAPGIDQFQGGYTVAPDIEIKIGDIGFAFLYSYVSLRTSEWESYVGGQGEDLFASGSLSQWGGVLRYYFLDTERHSMHLEGGASHLSIKGNEQYKGFDYEYDFLNSGVAFLGGTAFRQALNDRLSVVLGARFLWRPEGIKYPEGKTHDVFGISVLPGLKLTF